MNLRKRITALLACCGMLILILDGKTALSGASAGVALCFKTVIPSLFPFLFLSALLTNGLWGGQAFWMHSVGKKLGIPEGAESVLISAVLGGYPAGAQIVGSAYQGGTLSEADAKHLLSFCSNAGPAFLFGMTAAMFPDKETVWALWVIQLLSAALTAITGRHSPEHPAALPAADPSLSELLFRTIRVMATICGWVLLFQMVSTFLEKWILFLLPPEIQVLVTGLLELSSGCVCLNLVESIPLRFLICSICLSFGGLCVTMQTISVIGSLPALSYLTGKLRQTFFSLLLSALYLQLGWSILAVSCFFIWIFPFPAKKRSGFPSAQGV